MMPGYQHVRKMESDRESIRLDRRPGHRCGVQPGAFKLTGCCRRQVSNEVAFVVAEQFALRMVDARSAGREACAS